MKPAPLTSLLRPPEPLEWYQGASESEAPNSNQKPSTISGEAHQGSGSQMPRSRSGRIPLADT